MGPGNTGGMPITHYIMKYKLADQKDDPVKEVTWVKGKLQFFSSHASL